MIRTRFLDQQIKVLFVINNSEKGMHPDPNIDE